MTRDWLRALFVRGATLVERMRVNRGAVGRNMHAPPPASKPANLSGGTGIPGRGTAAGPLGAMLIRHEGLRLKPYRDTAGKLTIGVGRNLDDMGITRDEAMVLLDNDIRRIGREARAEFPWFRGLDEARRDALTDMLLNLGLTRFRMFTRTIAAIRARDWDGAASEMLDSLWARQVGDRARELAAMMRSGRYGA